MSLLATLRLEYINASSPVAFSKGSILTCNSPRILSYLSWRSIYYFCSLWFFRLHCRSFCWHTYTKSLEVIGHQKVVLNMDLKTFLPHLSAIMTMRYFKLFGNLQKIESWLDPHLHLLALCPLGSWSQAPVCCHHQGRPVDMMIWWYDDITSTCLLPSPR